MGHQSRPQVQGARHLALRALRPLHFRGKHRLSTTLGLDDPGLIPDDEPWVDCVEGIRFRTATTRDYMFRALNTDAEYQDDVLVALRNLLRPGQVFWDIGANYGFMSLYVDKVFKSQVDTVAFEPSPLVLPFLRENIEANQARVRIEPRCLSNESGSLSFYVSPENSWNATLVADFAEGHGETEEIKVEAVRLDDLVQEIPGPDVIKIDVEGAEHLVIAGGAEYLAANRPPIIAEYNLQGIEATGLSGADYLAMFRDLGYEAHVMSRPWVGWHRWSSLRPIQRADDLAPLCNIVLRPAA